MCLQGDADPAISLTIIQEYKYENILTLVTYYQMVGVAAASHDHL